MEIFEYAFMRNAIFIGILVSISCGIIGSYVVIKKISFISGGIAHAAFGGIGIAYFLNINPLWGAAAAALISALTIAKITYSNLFKEDTIIGILWAFGMALGIIFMYLTPGYAPDLTSFLFGNILLTDHTDIYLALAMNLLIIITVLFFYKELLAICFDEHFALTMGVRVKFLYYLLLILTALTVVLMIRIVGIVLIIALLTIPPATVKIFTYRFPIIISGAIFLGIFFVLSGLFVSFFFSLPSGATIIIIASFVYLISLTIQKFFLKP